VITDIHANLLALEACVTAVDSLGVDAVLCGGDLAELFFGDYSRLELRYQDIVNEQKRRLTR
jgi:hypothetical protein